MEPNDKIEKLLSPTYRPYLIRLLSECGNIFFFLGKTAESIEGFRSRYHCALEQGMGVSGFDPYIDACLAACDVLMEHDNYEDAAEESVGPGPSGNRKMKKNYRKPTQKKTYEKKPTKTVITRVIGIPDVAVTRLQYNDVISLTGTTAQYTFRANSLFDPDFTGTGHQPTYFDQYIASYERYRVVGCSIAISVVNRSFTDPAMCVVFPVTDVPTITSISQANEISRKKDSGILPSYQSIPIKRYIKVSTQEQIGLIMKSSVYTDDYAALFNANPVVLWYYGLYGWSPTAGGLDLIVDVQLNFDCEFFDRAPSTLSMEEQVARQFKICSDLQLAWKTRCLPKKS